MIEGEIRVEWGHKKTNQSRACRKKSKQTGLKNNKVQS